MSLALRLSLTSTWPWFTLIDAQMVGLPEYYMTSLRVSNQNHKKKVKQNQTNNSHSWSQKRYDQHHHFNESIGRVPCFHPWAKGLKATLPPALRKSVSKKTWTFYWSLMRFEMIQKLVFTVFTTKNTQKKRLTLMKCWLVVGRYPKWQNESLILLSLLDHQNVHA